MTDMDVSGGRNWPFTIRITLEERRLLRLAARRRKTSFAEVARLGLQPLFSRLETEDEATAPV